MRKRKIDSIIEQKNANMKSLCRNEGEENKAKGKSEKNERDYFGML